MSITLRAFVAAAIVAVASPSSSATDEQRQRYASLTDVTAKQNVEVVKAAVAAFNAGRDDDFIEAFSPSHRLRALGDEDSVAGRGALQQKLGALRTPFKDLKIVPTRFIAGKSFVAMQATLSGRQSGRFLGHAATQRRVGGEVLLIAYVGAGEIAQSVLAVPMRQMELQVTGMLDTPTPPSAAAQIVRTRARVDQRIVREVHDAVRLGVGLHMAEAAGMKSARATAFMPVAHPVARSTADAIGKAFESAGAPSIVVEDVLVAGDHVVALFTVSGTSHPRLKNGAIVARVANGAVVSAQTYLGEQL